MGKYRKSRIFITHAAVFAIVLAAAPASSAADQALLAGPGTIQGVGSGRCVDVPGSATADGTELILWTCHGGGNQIWSHEADDTIRNRGKCLAVAGGGNGSAAIITTCGTAANQRWTYDTTDQTLRNQGTGTCLDAEAGGTANGTAVIIWSCHGGANQQWLMPTEGGGDNTYYVDCSSTATPAGTITNPWNSLSQVNARTFAAGDQILFMRGVTCTGQLNARGSGTAVAPITVAAYGTGTARPVINGNGARQAIYLKDVSHWTLKALRVTNPSGTRGERNGIRVETSTTARKAGIVIDGLEVDHVAGWGNKTGTNAGWFSNSSGIIFVGQTPAGPIDGIRIVNNYVHDTGGGGIKISTRLNHNDRDIYNTGVYIGHNDIISAGGDGVVVHNSDAPLIEYNRADNLGGGAYPFEAGNFAGMWPINSRNPVFQFNEVTRSHPSVFDSSAWDCDGAIVGACTYQYNFSANNAGGFFLGCQDCTSFGNFRAKEVIRFNISQDDCRIMGRGYARTIEMYNNTFYCSSKPFDISLPTGTGSSTSIRNNIFVSAHGALTTGSNITYRDNLYYGGIGAPSGDTSAVKADPRLSHPGGSGTGFNSTDGYKLTTGSPAVDSGAAITGLGGRDFFGNPVPDSGGRVNIGADNGSGIPAHTYANLREAFNNTGITWDDNPKIGGFTVSGRSYSGEALAAHGFEYPSVTVNGVRFDWPQRYYGFPDNVKAAGQTIRLSGSGSGITVLGGSVQGAATGTGRVTYTDGTTSSYTLTLTDWWSAAPASGNTLAATMAYHHKPPTTYNDPSSGRDEQDVHLFTARIPITTGKTVASITLPSGDPLATDGMHIFALTVA